MKRMQVKTENEVYFIAEMSANHAGSLENALAIVQAAADAGADCVKIQTYTADTMTLDCDNDYFKIKGGLWDGYTLYQLYREAATPYEWHAPILRQAQACGIDFLSTPFDAGAVDFLESLGAEWYKIASFELTDLPLIEYTAKQGKPVVLSTGMGQAGEIEAAVAAIRKHSDAEIILLKCTSEYPAQPDDMNLATIADMAERFQTRVGLSDHSMGSMAAVTAALLGARVIEKHFCLSRELQNPDSAFSMQPQEFAQMIEDVNTALLMRGSVQYGPGLHEQSSLAFRRSVFAAEDITEGELFTTQNIRVIRPSHGLAPAYYPHLLGTPCKRAIKAGEPLTEEHICIPKNSTEQK